MSCPTTPPPRRAHRRAAAVVVSAAVLIATACDPPSEADEGRDGCAEVVRSASLAREVDRQVALLDDALRVCRTYEALTSEIDRYPSIIGYDTATFVEVRCGRADDETVRAAPACRTVASPTTTVPPTTVEAVSFAGATLDGRTIVLRPGPRTEFIGEVPAVVQQTVDIAVESGCSGVIAQRDLWAGRIGDPVIGDEASLYAQHAQNVADYIQCQTEPIDLDPAE